MTDSAALRPIATRPIATRPIAARALVRRAVALVFALAVASAAWALADVALPTVAHATEVHATEVHGDEEPDRYVGTGGLLLPPTIDVGTRTTVASCQGCRWRMTTPCFTSSEGNPFEGQAQCLSVARGCPNGQQFLRAWFRDGGLAWREIGLVCVAATGPMTVADVGAQTREHFVRDLAPPRVRNQPRSGMVTQIPVIFDSGQHEGIVTADYTIAGESVSLRATTTWLWEFGDGSSLATTDPGGSYPHDAVSHVYRRADRYQVRMTARWSATYTVAGLGPFEVPEPVTQASRLVLPVGEGRALLAVR